MTGKHTPGPWRVVADESAAQVTGFPCIEADGYTVVGLEGMYGDIETDFANARLIAAAPDLLDALADAVDAWETHCESGDMMQGDWVRDARAAIAKARGQE